MTIDTRKKFAKEARKNLRDGIELAKHKWSNHLASKIHKISRNPKDVLQAVNTLKDWLQ